MRKYGNIYITLLMLVSALAFISIVSSGERNSAFADPEGINVPEEISVEDSQNLEAKLPDIEREDKYQVQAVLTSKNSAVISGAMDGVLKRMPFNNGDTFKKGDVLVEYDCLFENAKHREVHAELKAVSRRVLAYERLKENEVVADVEYVSTLQEYEKIKAIHDQTKSRLKLCTIKAPFDGRVTDKVANNYEAVRSGRVLMEIGSVEPLKADLLIPSIWLRWLNIGTNLKISIHETGKSYDAKIQRIHGKIDPVTQTAYVVAEINQYEEELLSGMSGQASFSKASQSNASGFLGLKINADE